MPLSALADPKPIELDDLLNGSLSAVVPQLPLAERVRAHLALDGVRCETPPVRPVQKGTVFRVEWDKDACKELRKKVPPGGVLSIDFLLDGVKVDTQVAFELESTTSTRSTAVWKDSHVHLDNDKAPEGPYCHLWDRGTGWRACELPRGQSGGYALKLTAVGAAASTAVIDSMLAGKGAVTHLALHLPGEGKVLVSFAPQETPTGKQGSEEAEPAASTTVPPSIPTDWCEAEAAEPYGLTGRSAFLRVVEPWVTAVEADLGYLDALDQLWASDALDAAGRKAAFQKLDGHERAPAAVREFFVDGNDAKGALAKKWIDQARQVLGTSEASKLAAAARGRKGLGRRDAQEHMEDLWRAIDHVQRDVETGKQQTLLVSTKALVLHRDLPLTATGSVYIGCLDYSDTKMHVGMRLYELTEERFERVPMVPSDSPFALLLRVPKDAKGGARIPADTVGFSSMVYDASSDSAGSAAGVDKGAKTEPATKVLKYDVISFMKPRVTIEVDLKDEDDRVLVDANHLLHVDMLYRAILRTGIAALTYRQTHYTTKQLGGETYVDVDHGKGLPFEMEVVQGISLLGVKPRRASKMFVYPGLYLGVGIVETDGTEVRFFRSFHIGVEVGVTKNFSVALTGNLRSVQEPAPGNAPGQPISGDVQLRNVPKPVVGIVLNLSPNVFALAKKSL